MCREGTSPVLRRERSRKASDLSDYNNHILSLLKIKNVIVWLEHPIHIKESLGMIRGKNDKVDAQRIALYTYKNRDEVHLWTPKREVIQKLDRLTATRSRLVKVRKIRTDFYGLCKRCRIIFVIFLAPCHHGVNPMDKLVANSVQDQHLVLTLFDFALVVVLQFALRSDGCHCSQVK